MNKLQQGLGAGRKVTVAAVQTAPPTPVADPKDSALAREIRLKGTTNSSYPFENLRTGQEVLLVPDPMGSVVKPGIGHPDPDAISVQDLGNKHIAYIPAAQAAVFSRFKKLNPKMTMNARINEINPFTDKGKLLYSIVIMTCVNGLEADNE